MGSGVVEGKGTNSRGTVKAYKKIREIRFWAIGVIAYLLGFEIPLFSVCY
jgi:hypothetical protein